MKADVAAIERFLVPADRILDLGCWWGRITCAAAINKIIDQESIRWLISFLSVDRKKTFCLYEASSAESIREAARRAGIPADTIVKVGTEIVPSGQTDPLRKDRFKDNYGP